MIQTERKRQMEAKKKKRLANLQIKSRNLKPQSRQLKNSMLLNSSRSFCNNSMMDSSVVSGAGNDSSYISVQRVEDSDLVSSREDDVSMAGLDETVM